MMLEGSVVNMQNRKTAAFSKKNNKKHRETLGQNWVKVGILSLLTITHSLTHSLIPGIYMQWLRLLFHRRQ